METIKLKGGGVKVERDEHHLLFSTDFSGGTSCGIFFLGLTSLAYLVPYFALLFLPSEVDLINLFGNIPGQILFWTTLGIFDALFIFIAVYYRKRVKTWTFDRITETIECQVTPFRRSRHLIFKFSDLTRVITNSPMYDIAPGKYVTLVFKPNDRKFRIYESIYPGNIEQVVKQIEDILERPVRPYLQSWKTIFLPYNVALTLGVVILIIAFFLFISGFMLFSFLPVDSFYQFAAFVFAMTFLGCGFGLAGCQIWFNIHFTRIYRTKRREFEQAQDSVE